MGFAIAILVFVHGFAINLVIFAYLILGCWLD